MNFLNIFLVVFSLSNAFCWEYFPIIAQYVKVFNNYNVLDLRYMCLSRDIHLKLAKEAFNRSLTIVKRQDKTSPIPNQHKVLILMDLSCPDAMEHIIEAYLFGLLGMQHSWLIFRGDSQNSEYAYEFLLQGYLRIDSNVVIVENMTEGSYHIYDAYKINEKSRLIITSLGYFTSGLLHMTETRPTYLRRLNFQKEPLVMSNVIVLSESTRIHLDDRLDLKNDGITKMSWLIAKAGFESLNATPVAVFTNTWGYKNSNGSWNGMLRQFQLNEAHLGTLLFFTKERLEVADIAAKVDATTLRFIFRRPPLSFVANIYTLPFSKVLWWTICFVLLVSTIVLYAMYKLEYSIETENHGNGSFTLSDTLLMVTGAFCQQGMPFSLREHSSRVGTLTIFMTLMIIYAAYTANIVVLMRGKASRLRTLEDLYNSPITLGATDIDYNHYFIGRLNDTLRRKIYLNRIAPAGKKANFYHRDEGIEKLRKGLFALHMETNTAYRIIQKTFQEHEKCDLVEIDYIPEGRSSWLPSQRNSPYKEIFHIKLFRLRENGIQRAIQLRTMMQKPECSGQSADFSSVGFTDFKPAATLMCIGLASSTMILLLEIIYYRVSRRRRLVFPYVN